MVDRSKVKLRSLGLTKFHFLFVSNDGIITPAHPDAVVSGDDEGERPGQSPDLEVRPGEGMSGRAAAPEALLHCRRRRRRGGRRRPQGGG